MAFDNREEERPPARFGLRRLRLVLIALVFLFIAFSAGGQLVWFWLNILEFGEIYIRPIYFELLGGAILAFIALFRVDFRNKRSISWWLVRLFFKLVRYRTFSDVPPEHLDFKTFKMSPAKFLLWQVTKIIVGMLLFTNVLFGMTVQAMALGWDSGFGNLGSLLALPFVTPPPDPQYAVTRVIPLLPALTLFIPPIIGAIEVRLIVLLGVTQLLRVMTPSPGELTGEVQPRLGWRIAVIAGLAGVALVWAGVKSFFPAYIDYNTRVVIGGLWSAGALLLFLSYFYGIRRKGMWTPSRRALRMIALSLVIIGLLTGSVIGVQNSTADAAKLPWLGPYVTQEVGVNRFLADLDKVQEVGYVFGIVPTPPSQIASVALENRDLLQRARIWDWEGGFAKLRPEIGLLPFLDFEDSDILRFNGTLYWSASMAPILPPVRSEDRWYSEHLVYTHVPNGFLLIDGTEGKIIDSAQFFNQRRIYYGEGGLLEQVWAAYPVGRERSDEVGEFFYDGKGGIDVSPPLSWIFEFNFLLAFRDQSVHVLRYRDVYERMALLFPYFEYQTPEGRVDMFPVTDGERTFWLMPLVVSLDTEHVPWSVRNQFKRLVGYSLIDIKDGTIQIITVGDDYFTELFKLAYGDIVKTEIPDWLKTQLRYPEELFEWRVGMYDFYHVTDPSIFITAKEFYETPRGLDTYYIISKPPGFERAEFVGLLSLELRGAAGRNLAGYMVVRNDYSYLGEMIFYQVPLDSATKLLGPSAVIEALDRNPVFAQLKTLLRDPRIGDNILYRVGDHDVYFIPVYTAGTGGVVSQIGTVAAVGAAFTGEYYVGLGSNAEEAFTEYLASLGGVAAPPAVGKEQRLEILVSLFNSQGIDVLIPTAINPYVTFKEGSTVTYVSEDQRADAEALVINFIETWAKRTGRVLQWTEGANVNFGVLINVNGVIELRFITVSLE